MEMGRGWIIATHPRWKGGVAIIGLPKQFVGKEMAMSFCVWLGKVVFSCYVKFKESYCYNQRGSKQQCQKSAQHDLLESVAVVANNSWV